MAVTTEPKHFGLLIDGEWIERRDGKLLEVRSPNDGQVFATLPEATQADIDAAIEAAQRAYDKQELSAYQRYEILLKVSQLLLERVEDIAYHMSMEGGKPIKEARIEVARAASTILVASEEAKRIHGEQIPVEAAVGSEKRLAFTLRQPIGVICCISPFNFPAILVAHKIAPAIAAGNTVVLKPASATPVTAAKICQAFLDAGLPPGHLNLIVGGGATVGESLIQDERFAMYLVHRLTGGRQASAQQHRTPPRHPGIGRQLTRDCGQDRRRGRSCRSGSPGRVHERRSGVHLRPTHFGASRRRGGIPRGSGATR